MEGHWKKIVLVLAILLLSVAGYLLYIFQFKEYETADENVDQVIEEEYKVELPDGSTIIVDKEGNVVEGSEDTATDGEATESNTTEGGTAADGSASTGGTSAGDSATTTSSTGHSSNGSSPDQASGSKSSTGTFGSTGSATGGSNAKVGSGSFNTGSAGKESAGTETGGVTVASIKQKYEPTLADIEGQATSRINGLIGAIQSEYATKKANGENINYAYFYNKYMSAATELENRTDTVFYAVISSLKNDLKANGFAASHADSFVSEYEARKEARKKELISKVSGM